MFRSLVVALLMLLAARGVQAQQGLSSVRGAVEDSSGAVVAGAVVRLLDVSGAAVADVHTDASGAFVFEAVQPGAYQVRAEFSGFEPLVRPVSVAPGRRTTVPKFVLQIAGVTQDITVEREVSVVSTGAAANQDAIVMDAQALRDIPVFDRDIVGTLSRFPTLKRSNKY